MGNRNRVIFRGEFTNELICILIILVGSVLIGYFGNDLGILIDNL